MKNVTFSKASRSIATLALLAVVSLAGCGGGGGGGGSTPTPTVTTEVTTQAGADEILISGRASKGTILNATVRATQIIDGQLGGIQKDVILGADGDFSVSMPKGLVHLQVIPQANSTTQDEATGVAVALPPEFKFRAAADLTDSSATTVSLNITPFSEAGVALAEKSGGLTAANINKANSGIANILGFDHLSTKPIQSSDAVALASATTNEKKLSVLNAAVSNMAATDALGCGVQATYGQTIDCTVAKLADQFQMNNAASAPSMKALSMDMAGSTPMVMLGDKGYQSLLGSIANAVASGATALKNTSIEIVQDGFALSVSAATYAICANSNVCTGEALLGYQSILAGQFDKIDRANVDYKYAVISKLVYDDKWVNDNSWLNGNNPTLPSPMGDYTVLNWLNYGLTADDLSKAWSNGLAWGVFYNSDEIIIAYRGTEPTSVLNLMADLTATVTIPRFSDQYNLALDQFKILLSNAAFQKLLETRKIVLTGHSLGGGIASYVAGMRSPFVSSAIVFNSAPLGSISVLGSIPVAVDFDESKIHRDIIKGDPVSSLNYLGRYYPDKTPKVYPSPYAWFDIEGNHGIDTVLFVLGEAKGLCSTSPSCVAQNSTQPIQTPIGSTLPFAVTGIQSSYSTGITPYRPAISLSGSQLSTLNEISWACTQPNGASCPGSPYVWTPNDWTGKVDIFNDTSIKVYPRLLNLGDATGTYNWTATFTALNATPISIPFSVIYQPQAAATAPSVTYFKINNDASSTTSRTVTLNNLATGSPTHYMASESSSFSGASWQTYSIAPSFTLSSGDVTKSVYFKVKNSTGESTVVSDSISLNEATTSQYTLTVSKSGTGSGTVSATGLSCSGSTCTGSYSQGTSVTLSASASSGSTFAGWSGSGCSGTGSCTVTMNAATTVTATFNTSSNTLSITTTAFNPATATVGTGYAAQAAIAATGGQTPYSCSASGLPSGMAMNASTCAVYGTPTVSGTFNVTVTVTDSSNPQKTASKVLTLTVSPAATTTPTVSGISPTTFSSSSLPYAPVITVSGTYLDQIASVKYSWTGATSGTANGAWASTGTTSRTLNPGVLSNGDPSGTSTWTVRFYNSSGVEIAGTSKTFTVTYSPTTTVTVSGISPTTFSSSTTPYSPVITVSGTYLDQIASVKYSWTGATSGSANGVWASTGTTSRTLNPTVLTSGDPSGTSTWTVYFYNSSGSLITSKAFTVTYSPTSGGTQVERITNGSFTSGTSGWTLSGDFWAGTNLSRYYTSPGYASGGVDSAGAVKNYASGYMYQTVTIPSNATSATLSFWLNITSDETGSAYDYLYVEILNSSGALLTTPFTFSNVDKGPYCGATCTYSQKTANLLSFKGQTIRVKFRATTDIALSTVFRIDDVSLMADGN